MRRIAGIALLVAVMALSACPQDEPDVTPSDGGTSTSTPPQVVAPKGTYRYAAYGVRADMVPDDGDTWSLKVTNSTDHDLDAPSVYALDAADGHRINAKISESKPLDKGKSQDLTVTWDEEFIPEDIGLLILMFGDDNWGNFDFGR